MDLQKSKNPKFWRQKMTKHNKSVRDNIPEIIEESGHSCNVKPLSDSEFLVELEKKLIDVKMDLKDDLREIKKTTRGL